MGATREKSEFCDNLFSHKNALYCFVIIHFNIKLKTNGP